MVNYCNPQPGEFNLVALFWCWVGARFVLINSHCSAVFFVNSLAWRQDFCHVQYEIHTSSKPASYVSSTADIYLEPESPLTLNDLNDLTCSCSSVFQHKTWNMEPEIDINTSRHGWTSACSPLFFFAGGPKGTKILRFLSSRIQMDPSGRFSLVWLSNLGGGCLSKGCIILWFLFSKVGPKDQQYFHAVEQSLRKQGACFLRSRKKPKRTGCAAIYPGGTLFVYIWDTNQKGGQKFSGSSWEEVGGWKRKFWNERRRSWQILYMRGQNSSIILSELGLHPLYGNLRVNPG